jgi:hypothetical protein
MNPSEDNLARAVVWLMALVGLAFFSYGSYSLVDEGYNVRALWIAGGGFVLVLAAFAALSSVRR